MTTITLKSPTIVTRKKRRNPRSFKTWDSAMLTEVMYNAAEIKHQIEKISIETDTPMLADMKPRLIPTIMLYGIVDSYLKLHNTLQKEGLIQSSSVINNKTFH